MSTQGLSLRDLTLVTLLVRDISQYKEVNSHYVKNFGLNPPVRVCVQANIKEVLRMSAVGFKDMVSLHRGSEDSVNTVQVI